MAHTKPFPPDENVIQIPAPKKNPGTCIVQLGRYGDLINILPVAKLLHERTGRKPHVMVSRQFSDVLDGVSYVDPEIVDLPYDAIKPAIILANRRFERVIVSQVNGKDYFFETVTGNFNHESWVRAGFGDDWEDSKLVFDRRDRDRELALKHLHLSGSKPVLLLHLSGGVSSPYGSALEFQSRIIARWSTTFQIVDLNQIRATRIYDLLGLMDDSDWMICSDTSVLHLAEAARVRVIALINEPDWLGTLPRCNCKVTLNYEQALLRIEGVHSAILDWVVSGSQRGRKSGLGFNFRRSTPVIIHAVERHQYGWERDPRNEFSRRSWQQVYDTDFVLPSHLWNYKRDARDIGEKRALPYLRDVMQQAIEEMEPNDIVMLTNDDGIFHWGLAAAIRTHLAEFGVCYSRRVEVHDVSTIDLSAPANLVAKHTVGHMGCDLFAFTWSWLEKFWSKVPDLILGASEWDRCLESIVRWSKGLRCTNYNLMTQVPCCELPLGYLIHEIHEAAWIHPENRHSAPSQLHNRRLFKEWAQEYMPSLQFDENGAVPDLRGPK